VLDLKLFTLSTSGIFGTCKPGKPCMILFHVTTFIHIHLRLKQHGNERVKNSTIRFGRAIAQAVSLWLPTAAARFRARVWSSGICGGQNGAGAGLFRVLRFPLPILIPSNSPSSQSLGAGKTDQLVTDVLSGPSLDSTPHYAN
jgi:hypothetical protein